MLNDVLATKFKEVAATLKAIHAAEDAAQTKRTAVVEKLTAMKLKKDPEKIAESVRKPRGTSASHQSIIAKPLE